MCVCVYLYTYEYITILEILPWCKEEMCTYPMSITDLMYVVKSCITFANFCLNNLIKVRFSSTWMDIQVQSHKTVHTVT